MGIYNACPKNIRILLLCISTIALETLQPRPMTEWVNRRLFSHFHSNHTMRYTQRRFMMPSIRRRQSFGICISTIPWEITWPWCIWLCTWMVLIWCLHFNLTVGEYTSGFISLYINRRLSFDVSILTSPWENTRSGFISLYISRWLSFDVCISTSLWETTRSGFIFTRYKQMVVIWCLHFNLTVGVYTVCVHYTMQKQKAYTWHLHFNSAMRYYMA